MRRLERAALWMLLSYGLCGCTRTSEVKAEEHATVEEHATAQVEQHATETVQQGPETITTTVEEYETPSPQTGGSSNVQPGQPDAAANGAQREQRVGNPQAAGVAPRPPILIRRTVVVDQRGPVTDTKTAEAKGASTAALAATDDKKGEKETAIKVGIDWLFWLSVGGGVVLALGIAGVVAWKMKPPWLTAAIALVKKL